MNSRHVNDSAVVPLNSSNGVRTLNIQLIVEFDFLVMLEDERLKKDLVADRRCENEWAERALLKGNLK